MRARIRTRRETQNYTKKTLNPYLNTSSTFWDVGERFVPHRQQSQQVEEEGDECPDQQTTAAETHRSSGHVEHKNQNKNRWFWAQTQTPSSTFCVQCKATSVICMNNEQPGFQHLAQRHFNMQARKLNLVVGGRLIVLFSNKNLYRRTLGFSEVPIWERNLNMYK